MSCPYFFYGNCINENATADICNRYPCPIAKQEKEEKGKGGI